MNGYLNFYIFLNNKLFLFFLGQILCYISFPNQHFHMGIFIFVCFFPLFRCLQGVSRWVHRLTFCWLYFQCFFLLLFWMNPFTYYERYESWMMVLIYVLFYVLYPFIFACIFAFFDMRYPLKTIFLFPLVWLGFEWGMTKVSFGFPFSLAISMYNQPFFIQMARYWYIFGVSYLYVLGSCVMYGCLFVNINRIRLWILLLILCVIVLIIGVSGGLYMFQHSKNMTLSSNNYGTVF